MMLKNVVLPAPFGPIRLTMRLLRDREVDAVDGDEAAEALGDLLGAAGRRSSVVPRGAPAGILAEELLGAGRLAQRADDAGLVLVTEPSPISSAMCSSRRRRWLGNRPSGRNSIISTRAMP